MKKITVTLSDEAEKYFNTVAYELDTEDGKLATQSAVISHCLIELARFEQITGQSVSDYLSILHDKRSLSILIDPNKEYLVDYWIDEKGNKHNGLRYIKGEDLTENQINNWFVNNVLKPECK